VAREVTKEELMAKKATRRTPPRSPKAGRPIEDVPAVPRVRRHQKTATAAVRKDTMILQTPEGPRTRWGMRSKNIKKR